MKRQHLRLIIPIMSFSVILLLPNAAFSDWIHFKPVQDWNQGEVLEETEDAYVVRLPKKNIKRIRREAPSTEEGWTKGQDQTKKHHPKILWKEDASFITLRLPKEAIQSQSVDDIPETVFSESPPPEAGSLEERLARVEKKVETASFGEITGKVLQGGEPLQGCLVKIVMISRTSHLFSGGLLSGPKKSKGSLVQEARTDPDGTYNFKKVPPGEYDIYWKAAPDGSWVRRLSEYPDIVVIAGQVTEHKTIETRVRTIN